jgi:signal peptidase I
LKRRLLFFVAAILTALAGCNNRPSSGDRVLVAKFLYDTHLAEPDRFNVVVFKYPREPLEKNVPKNYIKRLLGLPGEILAIFFGRIFHIPAPEPGQPPYFNDPANPEIDPNNLWKKDVGMHENEGKELFAAGKFSIVRKTPHVMMAMRRIVYDNDFPAKDLQSPAWQRWHPTQGSGWTAATDHGFANQGASRDSVDWLRYRHILRPMNGEDLPAGGRKPELITDFMSYNSFFTQGGWDKTPRTPNWVGDLMLECTVQVTKAEGEFWMELSKGINVFQARWDLGTGTCTLFKIGSDGTKDELDSKPTRLKAPGSYQVRFANIDARLTVWVDRDLPFDDGRDYPPPEIRGLRDKDLDEAALRARRGPTENDLEPASIGSRGGVVQVRNIKLWRDTYYTQNAGEASDINTHTDPALTQLSPSDWSDPAKWAVFKDMPVKTMYVQPGHYLCLGDNSQQSSDSREWGLVPNRLLLGRALLVYFPFDRMGPIR